MAFLPHCLCSAEKRRHTDTAADEQIVRVRVERAVAEGRQNIHLVADLKLRELLCTRAANLEHKAQRAIFLIDVTMEIGRRSVLPGT